MSDDVKAAVVHTFFGSPRLIVTTPRLSDAQREKLAAYLRSPRVAAFVESQPWTDRRALTAAEARDLDDYLRT